MIEKKREHHLGLVPFCSTSEDPGTIRAAESFPAATGLPRNEKRTKHMACFPGLLTLHRKRQTPLPPLPPDDTLRRSDAAAHEPGEEVAGPQAVRVVVRRGDGDHQVDGAQRGEVPRIGILILVSARTEPRSHGTKIREVIFCG